MANEIPRRDPKARARRCLSSAALSVSAVFLLSGCTLLWAATCSPAGLPCAAPTPENPSGCLTGYTCTYDAQFDGGVCVPAAVKTEGETCSEDDECEDGLVCRDHFASNVCKDFDYDLNCDRVESDGLRCRKICDPDSVEQGTRSCTDGQRCYEDEKEEVSGYCQVGVCSADNQCGANNYCIEATLNADPGGDTGSGLCFRGCDPLDCNAAAGCNGCPSEDIDGDGVEEIMGCEALEGSATRFSCIEAGDVPYGGACDNVVNFCNPGSFCLFPIGANEGFCSRYCRLPSGAPACDGAATCNEITTGIGSCSQ